MDSVTLDTAMGWLAAAKPSSVLSLLNESEFAIAKNKAFLGFRINSKSYERQIVRQRLSQEIVQNETLAEKIAELVKDSDLAKNASEPSTTPEATSTVTVATLQKNNEQKLSLKINKLLAEREKNIIQRDSLQKSFTLLKQEHGVVQQKLKEAEAERNSQNHIAATQAKKIQHLEAELTRVNRERTALLKNLKEKKPQITTPAIPPQQLSINSSSQSQIWPDAVKRLLDKNQIIQAMTIAEDVLRESPQDATALEVMVQASKLRQEPAEYQKWADELLSVYILSGDTNQSTALLVELLTITLSPTHYVAAVNQWLRIVQTAHKSDLATIQTRLSHLQHLHASHYQWLSEHIKQRNSQLANTLMPPPGILGSDTNLPLGLSISYTSRQIVHAVLAGQIDAINSIRVALGALKRQDHSQYQNIFQSIIAAAEGDEAVTHPLIRSPRSAIVLDASNAAWHDQQHRISQQPRLKQILELRRTLLKRGYFPISIIADAPLPYTIDDRPTLESMIKHNEMSLVDSGVDADEALLREAKRLQAPLVTNDYMADWDMDNEVEKIRYTFMANGEAILES